MSLPYIAFAFNRYWQCSIQTIYLPEKWIRSQS